MPKGMVNVLPSKKTGALVDHLLHDPRVRVVSFTGSTEVGRKLLHAAADRVLKPAMELGGNAPLIVFEDADLDVSVEGAMLAKMRNLGEACTAANRFYVHEAVAEDFTRRFTARMAALKMGNELDEGVDVGPLVNAQTRDKVVRGRRRQGSRVAPWRNHPQRSGFLLPADRPRQGAEDRGGLADEIRPCRRDPDLHRSGRGHRPANDTEYGLAAYVFTRDMKHGMQVSERLDYGMVGLNRGLVSDPAAPFGGTRHRAWAARAGMRACSEFMETQYISASW